MNTGALIDVALRMGSRAVAFMLLAFGLLLAAPAQAQLRVSGTISAADTRQPVPGATVQVQRTRLGGVSTAKGEFSVEALPTDTLLFRALGFKTQRMALGNTGLSQLIVRIQLQRDSVKLDEVQVTADRPDRALINRALRNVKRPKPPVVSQVKRAPKPRPLFLVDSTAPPAVPPPTIGSPISLLYEEFSRAGKERRKMAEILEAEQAEKARKERAKYNKSFKDNRGYEP